MAESQGRKRLNPTENLTDNENDQQHSKRGRSADTAAAVITYDIGFDSEGWWLSMRDSSSALPPLASLVPPDTLWGVGIYHCGWTIQDVEVLSELLASRPTIHTLEVSTHPAPASISVDGARALARMCKTNTNIKRLKIIFRSPISRSALLGELVEPGSGGLTSEELELYTYMESDTPALAQLITANKSIVALGLRGSVDFHALKPALSVNARLKTLRLPNTALGDKGAAELAEILKANSTLEELHLENNGITAVGARAIAGALQSYNATLRTLAFDANSIGDAGAVDMAEMLESNTTLTSLSLRRSFICGEGVRRLAEVLKSNTTLSSLNLKSNDYDSAGRLALVDMIRKNTTLRTLLLDSPGDETPVLEALETNTTLTHVSMKHIGDVAVVAHMLSRNMALKEFRGFERAGLTSEEIQSLVDALEGNTNIEILCLGFYPLSDRYSRLEDLLRRNCALAHESLTDTKPASHA